MTLLTKFNLLYLSVFGLGLGAASYFSYSFLQNAARDQVLEQAKLMMETTLSTRKYTTQQIKPLLQAHQARHDTFLAQTVPAFAATETFNYLRGRYSEYTYKEATLNPTNLRDRAVDWETDVINIFRNYKQRTEVSGERDTPDGRALYLARPIVAEAVCLECHSTPSRAPASMIRIYGPDHGFGWKEGEVIGAQIASVPMSVPMAMAKKSFHELMLSLAGVGLLTLLVLDAALVMVVIRPVVRLSKLAERVSKGETDVPDLPVQGSDEIAQLGRAFGRMSVSLNKAMKMLEE